MITGLEVIMKSSQAQTSDICLNLNRLETEGGCISCHQASILKAEFMRHCGWFPAKAQTVASRILQ